MSNKKTLLFSIIGIILLVVMIIGISYAMYKFSGAGTKENVISSGTVSVSYAEDNTIQLTNQYSSVDAIGSANAETLEFTVSANITGNISVNYDLGIVNISSGRTLTDNYIKFNLKKGDTYLLGTSETTGITIGSRKNVFGTNNLVSAYALDSGTFNSTGNVTYTLKAWVSSDYELPQIDTSTENVHSNATTSETFSFKITVVASQ